jgi:hypothetical protein
MKKRKKLLFAAVVVVVLSAIASNLHSALSDVTNGADRQLPTTLAGEGYPDSDAPMYTNHTWGPSSPSSPRIGNMLAAVPDRRIENNDSKTSSYHQQILVTDRSQQQWRSDLTSMLEIVMEIIQVTDSDSATTFSLSTSNKSSSIVRDGHGDNNPSELEDKLKEALNRAGLSFLVPKNTSTVSTIKMSQWPHPVSLENILGVRKYRKQQDEKTFSHFLSHIPKSGASFALRLLGDLLWSNPAYLQLDSQDRFRPCNMGTAQPERFQTKWMGHSKGRKHICNLWMSEQGWSDRSMHNYIIVRNPRHHVLSQYFHCLESREHGKSHKMATNLTVWLESWDKATTNETIRQQNRKFFCYNPTNLQSAFVWPKKKKTKAVPNVTGGPNESNTPHDGDAIYKDLIQKFDVVGDTSRMVLSVCLIFIKYTSWIPPQCDCTGQLGVSDDHPSSSVSKVAGEYNPKVHAHGVQHHGATFATTEYQNVLIQRLTAMDQLLYETGQKVLDDQAAQVEAEYGLQICQNQLRHPAS